MPRVKHQRQLSESFGLYSTNYWEKLYRESQERLGAGNFFGPMDLGAWSLEPGVEFLITLASLSLCHQHYYYLFFSFVVMNYFGRLFHSTCPPGLQVGSPSSICLEIPVDDLVQDSLGHCLSYSVCLFNLIGFN